jgi:hypothetical protein
MSRSRLVWVAAALATLDLGMGVRVGSWRRAAAPTASAGDIWSSLGVFPGTRPEATLRQTDAQPLAESSFKPSTLTPIRRYDDQCGNNTPSFACSL